MNPRVRDLYKRFLLVGRDYPQGLDYVRKEVKAAFRRSAHISTDREINAAVNKGRYMVREMIALIQLKKYRTLRSAYQQPEESSGGAGGVVADLEARADAAAAKDAAQGRSSDAQ